MTWPNGPMASFDLETTSADSEDARIVTASLLGVRPQRGTTPDGDPHRWITLDRLGWFANPGIEIPAQAAAIHGITTEKARAEGDPAHLVVRAISVALAEYIHDGVPLVIMNAPYDLTVLDRELTRHGLPSLVDLAGAEPIVIDPLVLDKHEDQWRRGRRTLTHLSEHYGIPLEGAHIASADALAAMKVADAIGRRYPALGALDPQQLHKSQVEWAREQAASLQAYFTRQGRVTTVNPYWPMVPRSVAS